MTNYEVALQGLDEVWIAEYSRGHDRFRCRPTKEALSSNIRRAGRKDANSWALVAIDTRDHVNRVIKVIRDAQTILGYDHRPLLKVIALPRVFKSGKKANA